LQGNPARAGPEPAAHPNADGARRRPNKVFTRDQLLDAVWGSDRFVTPRSVDVYVRRLREKIEADPENPAHLKTVRGAGYLFDSRAS